MNTEKLIEMGNPYKDDMKQYPVNMVRGSLIMKDDKRSIQMEKG